MGPVPVVMGGVLAENRPQMPFVVDEHPVGAFGSCGAYPPLGIAVRTRGPRRGLHYLHALAAEDLVERTGELGVTVPGEEAEGAGPIAELHEQIAGLLRGPGAVRVGGHAEDVQVATSMTNRMYRRLRKIVSTAKNSQASSPCA